MTILAKVIYASKEQEIHVKVALAVANTLVPNTE